MLDPRDAHTEIERAWASVLARLDDVDADGWARPTPCAGWSVGDLAAHAAWGVAVEADGLRRLAEHRAGPPEAPAPAASAGSTAVRAALAGALPALLAGVAGLGPDDLARPVPTVVGDLPAGLALQMFTTEAAVHAGDVAVALGGDDTLSAGAVTAVAATLAAFLPAFAAAGAAPPPGVVVALTSPSAQLRLASGPEGWAPAPDTPATTTVHGFDTDVLLFALGRRDPADPRLAVTGDATVAARFKEYVPGP